MFMVELERGPSGLGMGLIDGMVRTLDLSPPPATCRLVLYSEHSQAGDRGPDCLLGLPLGAQCFPVGHTGSLIYDLARSRHGFHKFRGRVGVRYKVSSGESMCQHQQHLEAPASPQHTPLEAPGLYIQTLLPGSPAASDGRLSLGDQILEVNGSSLMGVSYMR